MLLNDSGCSLFIHFVMKVSPFGKCALPPFSFLPYPFFALDALRDVLNRIAHRKHLILPWRVTKPCCESSARCVNEASLQAALRWKETPLCHQGLAQAVTHPCPVFFFWGQGTTMWGNPLLICAFERNRRYFTMPARTDENINHDQYAKDFIEESIKYYLIRVKFMGSLI